MQKFCKRFQSELLEEQDELNESDERTNHLLSVISNGINTWTIERNIGKGKIR
jgi:hypothetical protein